MRQKMTCQTKTICNLRRFKSSKWNTLVLFLVLSHLFHCLCLYFFVCIDKEALVSFLDFTFIVCCRGRLGNHPILWRKQTPGLCVCPYILILSCKPHCRASPATRQCHWEALSVCFCHNSRKQPFHFYLLTSWLLSTLGRSTANWLCMCVEMAGCPSNQDTMASLSLYCDFLLPS